MNQHDQMRQALAILQHFRKHVDMEENTYNELVETCDNMEQALAAEPAPLVRLTMDDVSRLWAKTKNAKDYPGLNRPQAFANALMNAMEHLNSAKQ